jgi:hypothetical protein
VVEFPDAVQEFFLAHPAVLADGDLVSLGRLSPSATRLHPEDRGADALVAFRGRLPEQELGDLGGRLDAARVEFVAVVLPEGLRIDADDARDIGFGDAVGGKRFNLDASKNLPISRLM